VLFSADMESSFYYYCSTGIYLFIYSTGQDVQRYPRCRRGTVGEGDGPAAAATMTTRILTTLIKEVYAVAWKSFSIRVKPNQKKRF
jgi:hypothetical protein